MARGASNIVNVTDDLAAKSEHLGDVSKEQVQSAIKKSDVALKEEPAGDSTVEPVEAAPAAVEAAEPAMAAETAVEAKAEAPSASAEAVSVKASDKARSGSSLDASLSNINSHLISRVQANAETIEKKSGYETYPEETSDTQSASPSDDFRANIGIAADNSLRERQASDKQVVDTSSADHTVTSADQVEAEVKMDRVGRAAKKDSSIFSSIASNASGMVRKASEGLSRMTAPFREFRQSNKDQAKRQVSGKRTISTGNDLIGYLACEPYTNVGIREVSVGSNMLLAAIRQPGNTFLKRVNKKAGTNFSTEEFNNIETADDAMARLINAINNPSSYPHYVTVSKSPISEDPSSQKRRLVIHDGDGLRINPLSAKSFNADFDGDQATLHLVPAWTDKSGNNFAPRDAMHFILSGDDNGNPMIDADFFPPYAVGESRGDIKEAVEVIMDLISTHGRFGYKNSKPIAKAYVELSHAILYKDEDTVDAKLRGFMSAMRDNIPRTKSGYENYALEAFVFDTLFKVSTNFNEMDGETKARIRYEASGAEFIGAAELAAMDGITPEMMVEQYDRMLSVDALQTGRMSSTFEQYCVDMCRFLGEIPGKNVMFRAGQNDSKQAKRALETVFGAGNIEKMYDNSMQIMRASAMAGSAMDSNGTNFSWEWCRSQIIELVGDPGSIDGLNNAKGLDFRRKFATIYNVYADMFTQANHEALTDLSPYDDEAAHKKSKVSTAGRTFDTNWCAAFIDVYGERTLGSILDEDMFKFDSFDGRDNMTIGDVFSRKVNAVKAKKFGNVIYFINASYENESLRWFSENNRGISSEMSKWRGKRDDDGNLSEMSTICPVVDGKIANISWKNPSWKFKLICALANTKTASWSKFNRMVYDSGATAESRGEYRQNSLCESFGKAIFSIVHETKISGEQKADKLKEASSFIYSSSPEIFYKFGMNDGTTFWKSYYGKQFLAAAKAPRVEDTIDAVKNIRLVMAAHSVVSKKTDFQDRIFEIDDENVRNKYISKMLDEQEKIASRSSLWKTIMMDERGVSKSVCEALEQDVQTGAMWRAFVGSKGLGVNGALAIAETKEGRSTAYATEEDYAFVEGGKWGTAEDFLLDLSVPFSAKLNILTDFVRVVTGDPSILPYGIPSMVEASIPDRFSGANTRRTSGRSKFSGYANAPSLLDQLTDESQKRQASKKDTSSDKKSRKFRNGINLVSNKDAFAAAHETFILLNKFRTAAIEDMTRMYHVPDDMFFDAITSDVTFASGEKAKAENAVQSFYRAMSWQRNGGEFSDVYAAQDRILGRISIDDFSSMDFIAALFGKQSFEVYDKQGMVIEVSQESLLGKSFEAQHENGSYLGISDQGVDLERDEELSRIAAFFDSHPSLSYLLSTETAYPIPGSRLDQERDMGRGDFMSYRDDEDVIDDRSTDAIRHLRDVPEYAAIIRLITPQYGLPGVVVRARVERSEKALLGLISECVKGKKSGETFVFSMPQEFRDSVEKIRNGSSEYDARDESELLAYVTDDSDPMPIENFVETMIDMMADMCVENGWPVDQYSADGFSYTADSASIAAFYNTRQFLTRAQTSTNVGIQGGETHKTEAAFPFFASLDEESGFTKLNGLNAVQRFYETKRSFGSEGLSLKIAKSGTDGKFSITKKSKHLSANERENLRSMKRSFDAAMASGNRGDAVLILGKYLKDADESIGYKGFHSEQDYAEIANLMVRGDESTFGFITLPQAAFAIKNTLWSKGIDFFDKSAYDLVVSKSREIVDSMGFVPKSNDDFDSLSSIRGSKRLPSDRIFGNIRALSSSTKRSMQKLNEYWDVMSRKDTWSDQSFRAMVTASGNGGFKKASFINAGGVISLGKEARDRIDGMIESGYNVLTVVDNNIERNALDVIKDGKIIMTNRTLPPGGMNVLYVTKNNNWDKLLECASLAKDNHLTLAFEADMFADPGKINDWSVQDSLNEMLGGYPISLNGGVLIVPFFEYDLNPYGEPVSGSWYAHDDDIALVVEDTGNLMGLGDASSALTEYGQSSISIDHKGIFVDPVSEIFADTKAFYDDYCDRMAKYEYSVATKEEVDRLLMDGADFTPDLRVSKLNGDYNSIMNAFSRRMSRFKSAFDQSDENKIGYRVGDISYDEIVGFAKCVVTDTRTGQTYTTYAPITPFQNASDEKKKGVPVKYELDGENPVMYDKTRSAFVVKWKNPINDLSNRVIKIFEGNIGANKATVAGKPINDITLMDGSKVWMVSAAKSTVSRLLGTEGRIETMYSLLLKSRMNPWGFNFGDVDNAFGSVTISDADGNEIPLREAFKTRRLSMSEWKSILDQGKILWCNDEDVNSFLDFTVGKCIKRGINPSDFLASGWYGDNGDFANSGIQYDWKLIFETSRKYEDGFLKFMNLVSGDRICPYGLDGDTSNRQYLFRPFGNGVLKMLVPVQDENGRKLGASWQVVRASFAFASEDNTAMQKPILTGSRYLMQEIQQQIQSGRMVNNYNFGWFMMNALRDTANQDTIGDDIEFDLDSE